MAQMLASLSSWRPPDPVVSCPSYNPLTTKGPPIKMLRAEYRTATLSGTPIHITPDHRDLRKHKAQCEPGSGRLFHSLVAVPNIESHSPPETLHAQVRALCPLPEPFPFPPTRTARQRTQSSFWDTDILPCLPTQGCHKDKMAGGILWEVFSKLHTKAPGLP